MKKKFILSFGIAALAFSGLLFVPSCTSDFEEINTDPYGISDEDLAIDFKLVGEPFKQVLQNFYSYTPAWVTQLQQNLIGDVYSGYMMPPTPFANNSNNMTYNLVDGWNGVPWSTAYGSVMSPLLQVEQKAGDDFPEFKAWAKICRVEAMHRISDIYGPIIYTKFGQVTASGGIEYDCQEDAYDAFFTDLNDAIAVLTPLASSTSKPFANFDLVYDGDFTKWVKFANSLRLRLAVRISKVDPNRAKQEAEAAVNHPIGIISSNADNFLVRSDAGITHPLNVMDNAWNDIRMGAPMESILKGYSDPRLPKYFEPSLVTPGVHKGIRQGIAIAAKSDYQGFSTLVDLGNVQLMTAAEVFFLRAEGALRNWNMGGTAQSLYEQGVQASFSQYGLGDATAYLADGTSAAIPYVDPVNAVNNVDAPGLSTATIKWNDGDAFETKLEKIITQKWIAMYPDGQEAWTEFRRTGYPKLFPVVVNNSGGKISTSAFIKRINFPVSEYSTNPDEVQKAVQCLGGPDNGGTSLWWDVD
ncbi:MAG: SusD/RagB family nutrient-binding outer membrane lipoprotein [Saprospiraceae bacterium]|nr:SusD/RagB family nutrient-binding outer membrane lipoprotein [Saprospiraceae bacterium]